MRYTKKMRFKNPDPTFRKNRSGLFAKKKPLIRILDPAVRRMFFVLLFSKIDCGLTEKVFFENTKKKLGEEIPTQSAMPQYCIFFLLCPDTIQYYYNTPFLYKPCLYSAHSNSTQRKCIFPNYTSQRR